MKSMLLRLLAGFCLTLLFLGGCGLGSSSKQDILTRAEECKTKEDLQKALGKPSRVESVEVMTGLEPPEEIGKDIATGKPLVIRRPILEPQERWWYKASDGEVLFIISNGKITIRG